MNAKYEKSSNGERWLCPCCGSKVARVCETPKIGNIGGEPFLFLPRGFVFVQKRQVWLRPKNRLAHGIGRHEKSTRAYMSKSEELRQAVAALNATDEQGEEPLINTGHTPINVICPHLQCSRLLHVPGVRGFAA